MIDASRMEGKNNERSGEKRCYEGGGDGLVVIKKEGEERDEGDDVCLVHKRLKKGEEGEGRKDRKKRVVGVKRPIKRGCCCRAKHNCIPEFDRLPCDRYCPSLLLPRLPSPPPPKMTTIVAITNVDRTLTPTHPPTHPPSPPPRR
jgi:hypothetical protein